MDDVRGTNAGFGGVDESFKQAFSGMVDESFKRALSEIVDVCNNNNISIDTLPKVIANKKVTPMILGVGSEYDLLDLLRIDGIKAYKNEDKDTDLYIICGNGEERKAEVKNAAKDSFKVNREGAKLRVKCMRSRVTSSLKRAKERADVLGIDASLYLQHGDQYHAKDFDLVCTSITNSYINLELDDQQKEFLDRLKVNEDKRATWFWAFARDLASTSKNQFCNRRSCGKDCGFIPNHPFMRFLPGSIKPEKPWKRMFNLDNR